MSCLVLEDYEVRYNILMCSEYRNIKKSYFLAAEFECFLFSQSGLCRIFGEQKGTGQVFSPNTTVRFVTIIPSVICIHVFIYQKGCIIIAFENSVK